MLLEQAIRLEFERSLFLYKRNARGDVTPRAVEFDLEFCGVVDPIRVLPQKPYERIDPICNLFRFTDYLPGSLHMLSIARAFYVSSTLFPKTSHHTEHEILDKRIEQDYTIDR